MKDKRKIIAAAVAAIVLIAIVSYVAMRTPFDEQRPAIGAMAPELHLADVSGAMVSLEDHRGKVVLINFWAQWCPPCLDEFRWFERLYSDYKGKGLEIVAVSIDDLTVRQAMGIEVSFPVAIANERVLQAYGNVTSVPVSFLVGKDGRMIRKHKRAWSEEPLRAEIESALAMPYSPEQ